MASAGTSGIWPEIPSCLTAHYEKDNICLGDCTYQDWTDSLMVGVESVMGLKEVGPAGLACRWREPAAMGFGVT